MISRQATLLFPAGTTAQLVLPNGQTQPASNLTIRATEFTVGVNGEAAMPATLPPNSAYTYAIELSADEVVAAGAANPLEHNDDPRWALAGHDEPEARLPPERA